VHENTTKFYSLETMTFRRGFNIIEILL
jgi:hypothetical protein